MPKLNSDKLISQYNAGISMVDLAKAHDISVTSLWKILAGRPDYSPRKRCPWRADEMDYLLKLRAKENLSLTQLSERTGEPRARLFYWLSRHPDYAPNSRGGRKGYRAPHTLEKARKAREMRNQTPPATYQAIGDALGVTKQYVQHLLRLKVPDEK